MAGEQAELEVERLPSGEEGTALFRVAGDLDLSTVDKLRAAVGPACGTEQEVRIDLADLRFCDSTGVGAFVWLYRQVSAAGGRLVLCAPRGHVRDVLRISGVDRVIPILGAGLRQGDGGTAESGPDASGRGTGAASAGRGSGHPRTPRAAKRGSGPGGGAGRDGARRDTGRTELESRPAPDAGLAQRSAPDPNIA